MGVGMNNNKQARLNQHAFKKNVGMESAMDKSVYPLQQIESKIHQISISYDSYQNLLKDKTFDEVLQTRPQQLSARAREFAKKINNILGFYMQEKKMDTQTVLEKHPKLVPFYTILQEMKSSIVLDEKACDKLQREADKRHAAQEHQEKLVELTKTFGQVLLKKQTITEKSDT
ncbi:MAG: hypothetical protein FWE16_02810 [Firmicutes bacterium]|nr:hypothetical protein [Bacillota bacterium]